MSNLDRRLRFQKDGEIYRVYNNGHQFLGIVAKRKVGRWLHWTLVITRENVGESEELTFSAGCQDEIREFCRNPERYKEGEISV